VKRIFLGLLIWGVLGFGMSFYGTWDFTLRLLPILQIYGSNLVLNCVFAPGWRIQSESKIYSGGVFKYQNFYISGSFGEFNVWGKMYFHAQEVRYQKMWLNAEIPVGQGKFRASFNHWATRSDYSSYDRNMFGEWPCAEVVSWENAWKFIGREMYVVGPVAGYTYAGDLTLYIGGDATNPDRFEIYIPSGSVSAFEAKFGGAFWTGWIGKTVCVKDRIEGLRWTSGGPGGGGYSVARAYITDPSSLNLGSCPGVIISPACPGTTIKWFYAKNYEGQTVYIQGPVASITGPGTYHGYPNTYRVRIGGGAAAANRVEVIMSFNPGWPTVGTSYTNEVCVYGKVSVIGGIAVILPPDLISTSGSPCCGGGLPGMFVNWRYTFTWLPFKITADFSDCCKGTWFRQTKIELSDVALCCGLFLDASLTFTKAAGLEKVAFSLGDLYLPCCGITATVSAEFTPTSKTVKFEPRWRGVSGCFTVYGNVKWTPNIIQGIELYGFDITCYTGNVKLRLITAFDPDKVEDITDITFYTGEWEYMGLTYTGKGCCGGNLTLTLESWFGNRGLIFDFQRFRFNFEVPLASTITVFTKAQWNFANASPLDWFDVGWKISF